MQIILKRFDPRIWLPTLTLTWGIVTIAQGLIKNKAGLFGIRFRRVLSVNPLNSKAAHESSRSPGCCRSRSLPRCHLRLLGVLPQTRAQLESCNLLWWCSVGRCFWWNSRLCNWEDGGRRWSTWVGMVSAFVTLIGY